MTAGRSARRWSGLDPVLVDRLVLVGLVAIAAVLRFWELPTRGTWDADQGHDLLVLRGLVTAGEIPLLGPPTSIGDFHHGVLYYYLLAPVAALSGADPIAVAAAIAAAGTMAVAVTWWLARTIGGSLAGAVAGLLMAVSAAAVEESTFIWNPNLIALSSSVALACAWRAWTGGRPGWWIAGGAAAVVTMHCHVLGVALIPIVGGLLAADIRRRPAVRRPLLLAAAAGVGLVLASYVPLAVHELSSGFAETRAALAFLGGGGEGSGTSIPVRLAIVALRVVAWPLSGLVTAAPGAAILAAGLVVGLAGGRLVRAGEPERTAVRWLVLSLVWAIGVLTLLARSLATVVPGLPNDHYHAFADPIVFVLVGLGVAALARGPLLPGRAAAVAIVGTIVAFNLANQPPASAADGGWPAAERAAARIVDTVGLGSVPDPLPVLDSLPDFKSADAVRFPLVHLGLRDVKVRAGERPRVVLCDALFERAIGAACGGPAEDALVAGEALVLADRFQAAPGRWVSVYLPGGG